MGENCVIPIPIVYGFLVVLAIVERAAIALDEAD
jgi:hypothetical protein